MANPDRKMATVRRIDEVKPIDGADRIEQVIIGGWSVVVKKGEFHVGDYVVYIEIDAFLPVSNDLFSFLAPRGTRRMVHNGVEYEGHVLRTAKLRGVYSQGLVMDPADFGISPDVLADLCDRNVNISKQCGVWEWEDMNMQAEFVGRYDTWFAPRTDATRVQNISSDTLSRIARMDYFVSVKVDGTSITVTCDPRDGQTKVCSHNNIFDLTKPGIGQTAYECAKAQGIVDYCEANPGITVQAELCGPKIGGNRLGLEKPRLFVFSVFDMGTREYVDPYSVMSEQCVPKLDLDISQFESTSDMLAYVDGLRGNITPGRPDEGIVVHVLGRGSLNEYEARGVGVCLGPTMQLKAVSNKYLLKQK